MPIPTPIRNWIKQFTSDKGFFESSSDVDHDATSNRTHDGDDITPSSVTTQALEANNISITPVYDVALTFNGNETKVGLGNISPVSGQLIATARPLESNTNFLQATVEAIRYNSSQNVFSVNVSETFGNSGDIKLTVWEVGL